MGSVRLEEIVLKVQDVKPLPIAVGNIIRVTEEPTSTIQDLEEAILMDQVLTTRILRVANSAYYTYNRRISTISQAAVLIGFKAIKGIAFASVLSKLMNVELKGYEMNSNALWKQSQTCAIAAREISKRIRYKDQEEAYIAGLLHDFGKIILSQYLEKEYGEIMAMVTEDQIPFDQAEERVLGFSHTEIGAMVAEKWNLPKHLVDSIRWHHAPEQADDNIMMVNIVHVADSITMDIGGEGMGADGMAYARSNRALDMLGLDDVGYFDLISLVADIVSNENNFFVSI